MSSSSSLQNEPLPPSSFSSPPQPIINIGRQFSYDVEQFFRQQLLEMQNDTDFASVWLSCTSRSISQYFPTLERFCSFLNAHDESLPPLSNEQRELVISKFKEFISTQTTTV